MTAPQELRTRRLLLRSILRSDVPQIARLAAAREVAANTLRIPHPYNEADAEQFIDLMDEECRAGNAAAFAITLAGTGEVCGVIGLHVEPEHRRAELGFWLGVPYWGRGYCTEAAQAVVAFGFEVLKLNRIYAGHFKGNTASQRVMLKLGMRYEGCSRQHILKWDRFVDLENYALLASEFATRPTVK